MTGWLSVSLAGLGGIVVGLVVGALFGFVGGAMRERRRWMMEVPRRGELHFHDGPMNHFHVSAPDDALARLLQSSKR